MAARAVVVGLVAASVASHALAASAPCRFDFGNSTFDLSALTVSTFYPVQDSANSRGVRNYTYFINFCQDVDRRFMHEPACDETYPGPPVPSPAPSRTDPAPGYQVARPGVYVPAYDKCHRMGGSVGVAGNMVAGLYDRTNPSRGVYVQYRNGDLCAASYPDRNLTRTLRVWVLCYNDVANIPDEEVVLENAASCRFDIYLKSAFGCPVQCPLVRDTSTGQRTLCASHGVCDFDARLGTSRCFCNNGYEGDDCSTPAGGPAPAVTTTGGVLIGVAVFLSLVLGFLIYLWFFKISRLRLDTSAYSTLSSGPPADDAGVARTVELT